MIHLDENNELKKELIKEPDFDKAYVFYKSEEL